MTDTTPRQTTRAGRTPRKHLVVFWALLAVPVLLRFGEVPEMLILPVTAFGDVVGEFATHEMHMCAMVFGSGVAVAAVLVQVHLPASQVAAAWNYTVPTVLTVLTFGLAVALADLPTGVIPILVAAIGVAALAFFAHPSSLRAEAATTARPSVALFALTALAAMPLLVYAAGLQVAALGVASLGISAVSQLSTPWAVLVILWGGAFIAAGEIETRRNTPSTGPGRELAAAEQTVTHRTNR